MRVELGRRSGWAFNGRVLIERDREVEKLLQLLADAVDGEGRLVFLGGEAGVGKTSLMSAVAAAAPSGVEVRWGAADTLTAAAALGAVVDALPELQEMVGDPTGVDRLELFRRVRSMLASGSTLLVLEDLHWADEATLDLLRFLGRRLSGLRALLVVTYRPEDVPPHHVFSVMLGDLAGIRGVDRINLAPLSLGGVREFLASSSFGGDAELLYRTTGGNPFYLTEVVATGSDSLPGTIRDAVLARTARLSPSASRALSAAAVLGQRADAQVIATVAGEPMSAVDECIRNGLLVADGQSWAFRHELARLAVEQSLLPGVKASLHANALRVLAALDPSAHRVLAHHAAGAADFGALLGHAPPAAAAAARLGAHREAAAYYRLALQVPGLPADQRARFYESLSYECYLISEVEEALAARHRALDLFQMLDDRAAVGATERSLSRLSWLLGRSDDGRRYGLRAITTLEPLGDGHELAMAYSNMAQLSMLAGEITETVDWGERALASARRIGDREVEIHALNNIGSVLTSSDDVSEGRQYLTKSLDLALAADAHEHVGRAYTNLGYDGVINRQFSDAERYLRAGIAYCEDRDLDSWGHYMGAWLAVLLAEQGRYDEALAQAEMILRRPRLAPATTITASVAAAVVVMRRGGDGSGLLAEAAELAVGTGEVQRLVPVAAACAEAAWLAGNTAAIVAAVDIAWPAAVEHPNLWSIGELSWWLSVAGVVRPTQEPVGRPFELMLAGSWGEAAQAWEELGCPLWVAQSLGRSPDLDAAREAVDILDKIGAPAVREAVLRTRHANGLPVPRGPRTANRSHDAQLTPRELEVLALVAGGLSNADVSRQLYISEKTVGHHMSSILRKLDQPTRARAVALARSQGIVPSQ